MKNTFLIIPLLFCSLTSFSQDNIMVYEQIALDFFADSIIGHQESFKDCKVHYDGLVDSSITTIDFDLTLL